MSSTYAHYQGPSSLPSDYAILSALNSTYDNDNDEDDSDATESESTTYYRPKHPTISLPASSTPTESTPLLSNPPVPRIEEHNDLCQSAKRDLTLHMFWEEFAILARYSLPVFG